MSQTKSVTIKALGGYDRKSPADNLASANAVHSGIFTDPTDYPTPPVDEATFKGGIDLLSVKITASLDGGKKAIAERDHQEQVVIEMMRELSQYAEKACKNDLTTFLKSGFQVKPTATGAKPLLSQYIRNITAGKNSGQMTISLVAVEDAAAYEVRAVPIVNGTPGAPISQLVTKTRPGATFTGLTPGTTYNFQVRSFADEAGYTDWSDPISRICT
jgi:hypothetical protein